MQCKTEKALQVAADLYRPSLWRLSSLRDSIRHAQVEGSVTALRLAGPAYAYDRMRRLLRQLSLDREAIGDCCICVRNMQSTCISVLVANM